MADIGTHIRPTRYGTPEKVASEAKEFMDKAAQERKTRLQAEAQISTSDEQPRPNASSDSNAAVRSGSDGIAHSIDKRGDPDVDKRVLVPAAERSSSVGDSAVIEGVQATAQQSGEDAKAEKARKRAERAAEKAEKARKARKAADKAVEERKAAGDDPVSAEKAERAAERAERAERAAKKAADKVIKKAAEEAAREATSRAAQEAVAVGDETDVIAPVAEVAGEGVHIEAEAVSAGVDIPLVDATVAVPVAAITQAEEEIPTSVEDSVAAAAIAVAAAIASVTDVPVATDPIVSVSAPPVADPAPVTTPVTATPDNGASQQVDDNVLLALTSDDSTPESIEVDLSNPDDHQLVHFIRQKLTADGKLKDGQGISVTEEEYVMLKKMKEVSGAKKAPSVSSETKGKKRMRTPSSDSSHMDTSLGSVDHHQQQQQRPKKKKVEFAEPLTGSNSRAVLKTVPTFSSPIMPSSPPTPTPVPKPTSASTASTASNGSRKRQSSDSSQDTPIKRQRVSSTKNASSVLSNNQIALSLVRAMGEPMPSSARTQRYRGEASLVQQYFVARFRLLISRISSRRPSTLDAGTIQDILNELFGRLERVPAEVPNPVNPVDNNVSSPSESSDEEDDESSSGSDML